MFPRLRFLVPLASLAVACAAGGSDELGAGGTPATDPSIGAPSSGGASTSSGAPSPSSDAGAPGADAATGDGASTTVPEAAPPGPTAQQCLEGWQGYAGACPAPIIASSYVGNGCVGTTGWFIEGQNFQLEQHNVGIADYGPQSFGANGNQKHWNVISTTMLCVTVYAGYKSSWVGHTIHVVNPDGKSSNSVVVQDKL
jgi:hypothetical protein